MKRCWRMGLQKNYPQLGLNNMCVGVCVCGFSFWLVSVHKDVDVLFAGFCLFNVISATLQRDISVR